MFFKVYVKTKERKIDIIMGFLNGKEEVEMFFKQIFRFKNLLEVFYFEHRNFYRDQFSDQKFANSTQS